MTFANISSGGTDWAPIVAVWLICGAAGAIIGSNKKMGGTTGLVCGFLLGPLGVLIVALSSGRSTLQKVHARPTEAGWHPDPLGRFDGRYYDGKQWTQHVGRVGADGVRQQFEDPL
jgi:hypothetical protein